MALWLLWSIFIPEKCKWILFRKKLSFYAFSLGFGTRFQVDNKIFSDEITCYSEDAQQAQSCKSGSKECCFDTLINTGGWHGGKLRHQEIVQFHFGFSISSPVSVGQTMFVLYTDWNTEIIFVFKVLNTTRQKRSFYPFRVLAMTNNFIPLPEARPNLVLTFTLKSGNMSGKVSFHFSGYPLHICGKCVSKINYFTFLSLLDSVQLQIEIPCVWTFGQLLQF